VATARRVLAHAPQFVGSRALAGAVVGEVRQVQFESAHAPNNHLAHVARHVPLVEVQERH
jgi:hypothetical protein